jgi:energy-coupling factor transporter transmembrane protein EcfT
MIKLIGFSLTNNEAIVLIFIFTLIVLFSLSIIFLLFRVSGLIATSYTSIFKTIGKITVGLALFALSVFLIVAFTQWYNSPITVSKSKLLGNYVIDRAMFKGKNADWQYEHYRLKIDEDTLKLTIMNHGKEFKIYSKKITPIELENNSFFVFYGDYWQDKKITNPAMYGYFSQTDSLTLVARKMSIRNDTLNHHLLRVNPSISVLAHGFSIILYSPKYGNMFFKKGEWEE